MNLLVDNWIPVKRRSGKKEMIAVWQLTEGIENDPVTELDFARPDFKGGAIQFLISVIQTAFPPEDEVEWNKKYKSPPSPTALKKAFKKYEHAFNLDGDGPRFMQELELESGKTEPIERIFIDSAGEKGEDDNTDLFVKCGRIKQIDLSSVAIALFTLQINAPSGGRGRTTSPRGGGPMTTLLILKEKGLALWQTLWMNVLSKKEFEGTTGNPEKDKDVDKFPWFAKTKIYAKGGSTITPDDAHPLQVYWSMPRRIRLIFNKKSKGVCDLTGRSGKVVSKLMLKGGVKYDGGWRHPLSPYYGDNKKDTLSPIHPQPGGIGYRHWGALVFGERNDKKRELPAAIITAHRGGRLRRKYRANIFAFGFDMKKAKLNNWHESIMPIINIDEKFEKTFAEAIRNMVLASAEIANNLRQAVERVRFMKIEKKANKLKWKRRKPIPKDCFAFIKNEFWQTTEPLFYQKMNELLKIVTADSDDAPLLQSWFNHLRIASIKMFDRYTTSGSMEYENPQRIATARKEMQKFNYKKTIKEWLKLDQKIDKEEKE